MDGAVGSNGQRREETRLAILAPDYRAATIEAMERDLDRGQWFYVTAPRDVLGRLPGRYVTRTWHPGGSLSEAQWTAWRVMRARGWRSIEDRP